MASDVLQALIVSGRFASLHAMVGCPSGRVLCGRQGVDTTLDSELGATCMNTAVKYWLQAHRPETFEPILIVHADLPRLHAKDIAVLLDCALPDAVTVATDTRRLGSNAMLMHTNRLTQFAWGENSLHRHHAMCLRQGFRCAVVDRPGFAHDIDTPNDLLSVIEHHRRGGQLGACTAALCATAPWLDAENWRRSLAPPTTATCR